MVTGLSRIGKTTAIKYWNVLLAEDMPTLMRVTLLCIHKQVRAVTENHFLEWFLESVNHEFPSSGNAERKRKRLIEFLCERIAESWQRRAVLFFDDAQELHPDQYGWLMAITNELEKRGYQLTVVLVGQPDLEHQRSAFVRAKYLQLIGRFMVHSVQFHGIRSVDELAYCLRAYDDVARSEYPVGSGYSFTRFFLSESFDIGWRLESMAPLFWSVFREAVRAHEKLQIPMQYFTYVVEELLVSCQDTDPRETITAKTIQQAVENSGFKQRDVLFSKAETTRTEG
ncbi:MAG: ATP-binding protein [Gammaproteobacteria bacterium]|jgi:hypothetical protein|nr:ATP-binding protein [Gammaproteobacteria bacterium]